MRVAIYVRLSEEDRDKKSPENDSMSIQNQKAMLLQFALNNGWDVYDIYNDEDFKGADRNRPRWKDLLADAEHKKFDIILCKSQSRFTREMEMVEKYIHGLFPIWGIRFIGVVDNADTENKGNKKSRQINGLVNEWYLEDMSDSIKSALTTRREQGFHIGSFALYGYLKDPNNSGRLIIDEESAEVVREVFTMYANGYGKTAIARALNDRGIPNPTEYKRIKGVHYKTPKHKLGTIWKYFAIADMLCNEMYIGTMVQGKYGSISYRTGKNKPRPKDEWYRVPNTHDPIIDNELWERVQELLKLNAKPFGNGKVGLFSRKALCMNCGYTMRTNKQTDGRHYLMCGTRHTAKNACIGSFIAVPTLERAVLGELQNLLDENLDYDEVGRNVRLADNLDSRIAKLMSDRSMYNKKIAEYSKAVTDTYLDKSKGLITEEQYVEMSREFLAEKERLETLAQTIDEDIAALEVKRSRSNDKLRIAKEYATVERLDRVMVEKLIDHVLVGKRNKETKEVPVEIHWNF